MADKAEKTETTTKRAPSKPRPLFILMQVKDETGQVVKVDQSQIEIVACSRNAADVLEALDSGAHEGVIYKKFLAE